ncbi:hypothetical protein SALWKB2_0019 [Snodgrassella alvi wkB2]|nr:hypothetical protein SALWKB2_0019 [Snodgrassella alvi wkB2]
MFLYNQKQDSSLIIRWNVSSGGCEFEKVGLGCYKPLLIFLSV